MIWAAAISGIASIVAALLAAKAERNSRPLGNGFTTHLMEEIADIRRLMLDHIIVHDETWRIAPTRSDDREADC